MSGGIPIQGTLTPNGAFPIVDGPMQGPTVTITPSTTTQTTYYCRTSGNDTTGDGSSSNPWRTLQHALAQVPFVQTGLCTYRIDVTGLTETNFACTVPPYISDTPATFNPSPEVPAGNNEGYVTVFATPTVVLTLGNDAVSSIDPVSKLPIITQASASWTTDQFKGLMIAGVGFFQFGIIEGNNATQLFCSGGVVTGPFQILSPGATFTSASGGVAFTFNNVKSPVAFSGLGIYSVDNSSQSLQIDTSGYIFLNGCHLSGFFYCLWAESFQCWGSYLEGESGGSAQNDTLIYAGQIGFSYGFNRGMTPVLNTANVGFQFNCNESVRIENTLSITYISCHVTTLGISVEGFVSATNVRVDNCGLGMPHQNPNGSAVMVFSGGALQIGPDGGGLGGSGSSGFGLEVQAGGCVAFEDGHNPTVSTLTVTGTMGDLRVGRKTRSWTDFFANHPILTFSDPSTGASVAPNAHAEVVPLFEEYSATGTGGFPTRPAATAVARGVVIRETDTGALQMSDGTSAWLPVGDAYAPGAPSNWANTPPSTVNAAIDRIAALVKTLNGGTPIP